MEELLEIYKKAETLSDRLDQLSQKGIDRLRLELWGASATTKPTSADAAVPLNATPVPKVKRAKRLSALQEDEEMAAGRSLSFDTGSEQASVAHLQTRLSQQGRDSARASSSTIPAPQRSRSSTKLLAIADEYREAAVMSVTTTISTTDTTISSDSNAVRSSHSPVGVHSMAAPPPNGSSAFAESGHFLEPAVTHRPQRLAKLKSEKNLKEPKLNKKMRRPSANGHGIKEERTSVVPAAATADSTVTVGAEEDSPNTSNNNNSTLTNNSLESLKGLVIKVKREKISLTNPDGAPGIEQSADSFAASAAVAPVVALPKQWKVESSCDESSTAMTSSVSANTKKSRKQRKETVHKPIKVERFSTIGADASPVASRTRKNSLDRPQQQPHLTEKATERAASVYEDAVDNLSCVESANAMPAIGKVSASTQQVANETITIVGRVDATFCAGAEPCVANIDATFNVEQQHDDRHASLASSRPSMASAKDTSPPNELNDDDVVDDSDEEVPPKGTTTGRLPIKGKPPRANELFNPLIQSPVKMKVKAFENAAALNEPARSMRPKRTKENANVASDSTITPLIGKLTMPQLGRFLTPTQSTNILALTQAAKKGPNSASKAMAFPKAVTNLRAGTVAGPGSATKPMLSRENSNDDLRKGIHQLAEERKKQREQKNLLAAQRRETKERERAERLAKITKEREEKQLRKQLDAEHKRRELEHIQRKLRQQEEAEAAEAAKQQKAVKGKSVIEQERLLLQQIKKQAAAGVIGSGAKPKATMMPPPAKVQQQYTFEMLHEYDSTDDEGKVTYKRPPPPLWSQSHVRGQAILVQQYFPNEVLDCFFSVQPMTINLKEIFPDIDARHLKRNSSVCWATPPRYSELPKY